MVVTQFLSRMDRPTLFNLTSDRLDFDLQNPIADFNLSRDVIRFDLEGETEGSEGIRLLEDGGRRNLENGSFRLLE